MCANVVSRLLIPLFPLGVDTPFFCLYFFVEGRLLAPVSRFPSLFFCSFHSVSFCLRSASSGRALVEKTDERIEELEQ